jgi:hypothetical protein
MTSDAFSYTDPRLWLAAASLVIAACSAILSWRSFQNARKALAISERQEKRREPEFRVYLVNGYRRLVQDRQVFAFTVSISNPSDINNSVVRAELRALCVADQTQIVLRVEHDGTLDLPIEDARQQGPNPFILPARIDAHQTISGCLLFAIPNAIIGERTIDKHDLILEDTHGVPTVADSIMVRAWIDETKNS